MAPALGRLLDGFADKLFSSAADTAAIQRVGAPFLRKRFLEAAAASDRRLCSLCSLWLNSFADSVRDPEWFSAASFWYAHFAAFSVAAEDCRDPVVLPFWRKRIKIVV